MFRKLKDLTGFSTSAKPRPDTCCSFREAARKIPGWAWELAVLAFLILILRHWLGRRDRKVLMPTEMIELPTSRESTHGEIPESVTAAPGPRPEPAASVGDMTPLEPDDLERVEGIGPRVAELLRSSGVTTYAQLAQSDVEHLRQMLREVGLAMIRPDTWPEQAKLASAGDWDALKALQAEAKSSRRR
jgi:predicted flap endonuclease-1-like 5' DNA nuclease